MIIVSGELDMETVDLLKASMSDAITVDGATTVIVDFTAVSFCDSAGIAALDRAYWSAGQRGVRFRLASPQPAVARVLEITGVLDQLTQS